MAVDLREFVELWAKLHVSVSPHEARALFGKYAAPGAAQLSYAQFESAFTDKRSRRGAGAGVRKGAFVAGQPATFQGKILYAQCRTGVFPPSNWDPELATRSARTTPRPPCLHLLHVRRTCASRLMCRDSVSAAHADTSNV